MRHTMGVTKDLANAFTPFLSIQFSDTAGRVLTFSHWANTRKTLECPCSVSHPRRFLTSAFWVTALWTLNQILSSVDLGVSDRFSSYRTHMPPGVIFNPILSLLCSFSLTFFVDQFIKGLGKISIPYLNFQGSVGWEASHDTCHHGLCNLVLPLLPLPFVSFSFFLNMEFPFPGPPM